MQCSAVQCNAMRCIYVDKRKESGKEVERMKAGVKVQVKGENIEGKIGQNKSSHRMKQNEVRLDKIK